MILLDTDVIVDVARGYSPALAWLRAVDARQELAVSGFTVMEAISGCRNKSELMRTQRVLMRFRVLWLTPEECDTAIEVYARFRLSHGAGLLDTLVGQTAIANRLTIFTFNHKHFRFLPGIELAEPYLRT